MPLAKVVDHLLNELKKSADSNLESDEIFELFVSDLVTRDFGLSWDEIESGIVDGENDGQIDAVYILIDDNLIRDKKEFDKGAVRRNAILRVLLLQSKNKVSFEENPFSKMRASIEDLYDSEKTLKSLAKSYNQSVIA